MNIQIFVSTVIRRINKKGQVDYGLPREIDLIDYISLFEEIKKCNGSLN